MIAGNKVEKMYHTTTKAADQMIDRIDDLVQNALKNGPHISSAVVKSVNTDHTVNIYIPPDIDNVFTNILNQTPFQLNPGDSVEVMLKNGSYTNCWIIAKHEESFDGSWQTTIMQQTTSSGGGGGGTNNYNELINKPKINNMTVTGDNPGSYYGLQNAITTVGLLKGTGSNVQAAVAGTDYVAPGSGELVPSGGTTGQVLVKRTGTNYDTEWATVPSLDDLTVLFTWLSAGSQPTATYDPLTYTMTIGLPENIHYVTFAEYEEMREAGTLDPNAYYAIGSEDVWD